MDGRRAVEGVIEVFVWFPFLGPFFCRGGGGDVAAIITAGTSPPLPSPAGICFTTTTAGFLF